jgi:hypothetical protein
MPRSAKELAERLDDVLYGDWEPHPLPTQASISEIEERLRIQLPEELIEVAKHSRKFSNLFLSLGPDFGSHSHIVPYNQYWKRRRRTRRLPTDLVIVTNGFMDEDFWCLVRNSGNPLAVEYWSPAPIGYPKCGVRGERFSSFLSFLEMLIEFYGKRASH